MYDFNLFGACVDRWLYRRIDETLMSDGAHCCWTGMVTEGRVMYLANALRSFQHLVFPCWGWPSSSCAWSRCALQGESGVSKSMRKSSDVSWSGNLGWKPRKWACLSGRGELMAGAELLSNLFPTSWVWKSMRQHELSGSQRKREKKNSRRQTENPTSLLFVFTQFGIIH